MATSAHERKASLQKQIEDLQKKMQELDAEAGHELKLKLSDARKVVSELEDELTQLTGKPVSGEPKVKRTRRPSIANDALQDQILKVMANFGQDGMNAKQLAEKLHQDAIRIRKFITENPKVLERKGSGPGTKFFLA